MATKPLEYYVPPSVLASLTPEEREELDNFFKERFAGGSLNVFGLFRNLGAAGGAVKYLILAAPLKYSLLMDKRLSEDEVLELLRFDNTRLDEFHGLLYQESPEAGAWEQKATSVEAVLGHKELSYENAKLILEELLASHPESYTPRGLMDAISNQLLDKWSPELFGVGSLTALVELMEKYEARTLIGKYRRYLKKAQRA